MRMGSKDDPLPQAGQTWFMDGLGSWRPRWRKPPCPTCKGTGKGEAYMNLDESGYFDDWYECDTCNGTGCADCTNEDDPRADR